MNLPTWLQYCLALYILTVIAGVVDDVKNLKSVPLAIGTTASAVVVVVSLTAYYNDSFAVFFGNALPLLILAAFSFDMLALKIEFGRKMPEPAPLWAEWTPVAILMTFMLAAYISGMLAWYKQLVVAP